MRRINLETWRRREHFEVFRDWDYPHFNICSNVDLTDFLPWVKQRNISFTVAIVYLIARVANEVPEFRIRIRGREVVEHEVVHPSTTILAQHDLFTFCTILYDEDFARFTVLAAEQIEKVKANPTLEEDPNRDDVLYMTAIPWVSFTSFMHPLHLSPPDSIPRFAWGKFFQAGDRWEMPLSVQGHHALMDGVHMGRFYAQMQELLNRPELVLRDA